MLEDMEWVLVYSGDVGGGVYESSADASVGDFYWGFVDDCGVGVLLLHFFLFASLYV